MSMLLFGESLNVMVKRIGRAFKERDPKPIQEEALMQKEKGMDYVDLNIGPAKKDGPDLMKWVVETVQEVVDLPLLLDTSNIDAIEAGLKVCNKPPIINSIMCRPERYEKMLPLAAEYGADFVALMWGPEGLPRDEHERVALCVELLTAANAAGIPNEKIWVDGVVTPVNVQQDHAMKLIKFYEMLYGELAEMFPGVRSTCGLSNVSNGAPDHLRPILNQTYAVMLMRKGMQSIITDPKDDVLNDIAKGKREDIVDVIYKTMDGEEPDMGSLSKELQDYVKTTNVLMGKTLYSDSWLEL